MRMRSKLQSALDLFLVLSIVSLCLSCGHYERKYNGDPVDEGDENPYTDGGGDDDAGGIIENEPPLPDFVWTDYQGEDVHLYNFKDDVVILNVGAGWCLPCREEAPLLESEIWQTYKDDGFQLIELIVEDDEANDATSDFADGWRDEYGLTYLVCADPDWSLLDYFPDPSQPALPFSLFLDRNLVPRFRTSGYDKDLYVYLIESLL